MIEPVRAR